MRLLALAVVVQLAAGLLSAALLSERPAAEPSTTQVRARAVPVAPVQDRASAVEALLEQRAAAVLAADREAFLAGVDPAAEQLLARQVALFDALSEVPLASWSYVLDRTSASPPDARLDAAHGRGQWWAPQVSLQYALEGVDARPVSTDQHLTFVLREDRWLLGADDDFARHGRDTPRALWDRGPVVAVRDGGALVLGRPDQEPLLREVAALTAAAVPVVTAVWGPWSQRVAVLVPSSADELASMLGGSDVSQIAAVATAELRGGAGTHDPTGDRVLINPETFGGLGQLGRRVVLTHEVTHVATRRASGPAVPAWLAEGFADHVGYLDVELPVSVSARHLAREVRAGTLPAALPDAAAFDGSSLRLSETYEASWLAVRLLVQQHGLPAVLRFYRSVGAARTGTPEEAVERGLREVLGTSTAAFTASWRAAVQRQLG